jgi:hypothetical protein
MKRMTPPRWPKGDGPELSEEQIQWLVDKHILTKEEAEALLRNEARKIRKRNWLIETDPPDLRDRFHSITAADLITTPKLNSLCLLGVSHSVAQSKRSSQPRGRLDSGGSTLVELVTQLAARRDELGNFITAKELWPQLYSCLDRLELEPKEYWNPSNNSKSRISYYFAGGEKKITFGRFQNVISKARRGWKSR